MRYNVMTIMATGSMAIYQFATEAEVISAYGTFVNTVGSLQFWAYDNTTAQWTLQWGPEL